MQAINHGLTHIYQPTSTTCGYASLAMLLSHYGENLSVKELVSQTPQAVDESGASIGSVTAQLATWCVKQGYQAKSVSFDLLITDLSWIGLNSEELAEKLEALKEIRDVPQVGGKHWSKTYVQAYIDFIRAGGNLSVEPHPTAQILYNWLQDGPIYANICSSVVHGTGRARHPEPETDKRLTVPDDTHGTVGTHSVVIYGNDEAGNFLVADPWDGLEVVKPETMLCGIMAAQLECDNQIFQLSKT